MPEAGNHWFKTYYLYYIQQLYIDQSIYDPCLLQSNKLFSIVDLQTDDTLFLADKTFAETEQNELYKAKFIAKEHEQLIVNILFKFNDSLIQLASNRTIITLTQKRQYKNLNTISIKPAISTSSRGVTYTSLTSKDQYITQHTRGAYIVSVCQPETLFDLSFAAQVINPVKDNTKSFNKQLS
jgi:hypothetical protein